MSAKDFAEQHAGAKCVTYGEPGRVVGWYNSGSLLDMICVELDSPPPGVRLHNRSSTNWLVAVFTVPDASVKHFTRTSPNAVLLLPSGSASAHTGYAHMGAKAFAEKYAGFKMRHDLDQNWEYNRSVVVGYRQDTSFGQQVLLSGPQMVDTYGDKLKVIPELVLTYPTAYTDRVGLFVLSDHLYPYANLEGTAGFTMKTGAGPAKRVVPEWPSACPRCKGPAVELFSGLVCKAGCRDPRRRS